MACKCVCATYSLTVCMWLEEPHTGTNIQQLSALLQVRRTRLQQNRDSAEIECSVHEQADKLRLQYTARTAEQGLRSEVKPQGS